jgi:hypothetical protein
MVLVIFLGFLEVLNFMTQLYPLTQTTTPISHQFLTPLIQEQYQYSFALEFTLKHPQLVFLKILNSLVKIKQKRALILEHPLANFC